MVICSITRDYYTTTRKDYRSRRSKIYYLVNGIKTSIAQKLNETIAKVIDDFSSGSMVKQDKAITNLMGQMSKLGLSVDELTRDFKDAKDILMV